MQFDFLDAATEAEKLGWNVSVLAEPIIKVDKDAQTFTGSGSEALARIERIEEHDMGLQEALRVRQQEAEREEVTKLLRQTGRLLDAKPSAVADERLAATITELLSRDDPRVKFVRERLEEALA